MTGESDAVATRRALLAGALGAGGSVALASALGDTADAAAPIPTNPSSRYFLLVGGIEGESQDARHANWIDLLTFSWGASTTVSPLATTSGTPASRSKPADLVFVARSSRASPKLFLACATGVKINRVQLDVARSGGDQAVYLTVTLQNVRVASYNEAPGATDGLPLDVVRLRYAKVTHSYRRQRADGSLDAAVVAGFDFAANTAF